MKPNVKKLIGRVLESGGKLRMYPKPTKKNEGKLKREEELPQDKYFVEIPADDMDGMEVSVKDGDVCVGPFDTAADAEDAAGDLTVVNDEGTPVMDDSGFTEKKLKERARAKVSNMIAKTEAALDVNTDIDAIDLSTTDGAGALVVHDTDNQVANPTPDTDPGTLNAETDRQPDVVQSGTDTPVDVPVPDPDIDQSTLDAHGDADITESHDAQIGSFVLVKERGGNVPKQVDSGVVETADRTSFTVNGEKYERTKYFSIKIA